MKCPFCNKDLVAGSLEKFETLVEHGFEPNKTDYPLRKTWVCSCPISKNSFWSNNGSFYSKEGFNRQLAKEFVSGNFSALRSWELWNEKENKFEEFLRNKLGFSWKKSFQLGNFIFKFIEPKFRQE